MTAMNSETLGAEDIAERALQAYQDDHLDTAAAGFRDAMQSFSSRGDHLKAAEMANNLCVVLLRLEDPEGALAAVEDTPEVFAAHGDDQRTAMAYGNLASAREAGSDLEGAQRAYRQAADLFAEIGDTDSRAHTLKALSQLQLRKGQTMDAVASMQAGLEGQTGLNFWQRLLRRILRLPYRLLGR
jgi:tetratricopeptide (TPR) repeat protein